MATVTKDVIVLVPGFLGSVLEKDGKELWGLSQGALLRALLSLGDSVGSLELKGDGTDEVASDGVTAPRLLPDTHLLPGLWKIDGYTHVSETLVSRFGLLPGYNYFEFPYDWRRDVRLAARRLARLAPEWLEHWRHSLGGSPDSRLILVGHSLGGLVSRYFLEVLGGWRHTRALITFGTPHRGSLIAVDKLANGFQKRLGPLPLVDLTRMVRSLHPIYQLLPRYPCVGMPDGSVVRPTEAVGLPNMDLERARQGREFMLEIDRAVEANLRDEEYLTRGYLLHPVVGINQPTLQGARLTAAGLEMLYTEPGGEDPGGDGTVPRVSAMPLEERHHARAMYSPTPHASLQNAFEVLAHVEGLLTGHELLLSKYRELRGPNPRQLSLRMEDAYAHDEPVAVRVRPSAEPVALVAWLTRLETGETSKLALERGKEGWHEGTHAPLPPGVYRLTVKGGPEVLPVSDVFAVFPQSLDGPLGLPVPEPKPDEPLRTGESQKSALSLRSPHEAEAEAEAWDEAHAITRTPSVEPLGPAQAGQLLSLRVDLRLESHHDSPTESTGFSLSGLAPDWKQLPVEVHVACPGMTFGEGEDRGVVLVRREQKSVAATLTGTVNADAKGELVAMVTFEHSGRLCGFARRRIPVEAAPAGGAGTPGPSFSSSSPPPTPRGMGARSEATVGTMTLEAEAAAPHLTVYILRSESSGPQLQWLLTVPVECEGLPARMSALVDVGADGAAFFQGVATTARELRPGDHYAWFQGLGRLLYERTPPEFRQAYQALRRRYGPGFPIQLVTNEPHIPWELMLPADVPGADLLCLEHPVGRWLLDYQTWMTSRLPRGDILTVAPDYTHHPHLEPLPQAQVESRLLQQRFNARPVRGRRREVLGVLTKGHERPVALLHFAGHGAYSGDPVTPSRIYLEDGALLTLEVRSPGVQLGLHSRPLVLFNACEVGASSEVLGSMGGWAEAFISQRFGGFIAPMWPVQDAHARAVAERLLADLLEKGLSVGEALRSIRASEARTSPTFLSYVYVGDVLARLTPQAAPAHQGAAA